jgi:hypothetical protein
MLSEMSGGDWRAFSFGDGEKEQTNEGNGQTDFDGIFGCGGMHQRKSTTTEAAATWRQPAAGNFTGHDRR